MDIFGTLDGRQVTRSHLRDGDVAVSILNYGCVTQDWQVPVGGGRHSVVLGFDRFADYPVHSRSFGIIAGRVANRIAAGRFELDGVSYQLATNNGANHLHGGDVGLGRRLWTMEPDSAGNAVCLTYRSPDGEDGYPGAVDFRVVISLRGAALSYDMEARTDRPTPINLAQHNYYLLGGADVRDHTVQVDASGYTPVDDGLIPTGEIAALDGCHFDHRTATRIDAADPEGIGTDLNMVLTPGRDSSRPAATVSHENGLTLRLWTDQPGIQMFNAPDMDVVVPDGPTFGRFGGLCLEPQKFPDAVNKPNFPSVIVSPEVAYRQKLTVEIK